MEQKIAHKSEYESNGCKYTVTSYYSERSTEKLEDILVRLVSDRILMKNEPQKTPII